MLWLKIVLFSSQAGYHGESHFILSLDKKFSGKVGMLF